VKHLSYAYAPDSEYMRHARYMSELEGQYVYEMLKGECQKYNVFPNLFWVMTNVQQPYDEIDGMPVCSVREALEGIRDAPPVLTHEVVVEIVKAVHGRFRPAGTPQAR
jgi:hypothetical protein